MRILLLEFDLFKSMGGGQTVYKAIINNRPQDTFYYFIREEGKNNFRPSNAIPIPFKWIYQQNIKNIPVEQMHFYNVFFYTQNMARAVADALEDTSFDVVDTPDYEQFGLFIRQSLEMHDIKVGTVALSLHGTISSSLKTNWPLPKNVSRTIAELRLREHLQFRVVDTRYGISEMYAQELQKYAPLHVNILDPLTILKNERPAKISGDLNKPDIYFIGRREKCKGPDLFVDLVWWLPKGTYNDVYIIGPDSVNAAGIGSEEIINRAAKLRGIKININSGVEYVEIFKIFMKRSIIVLPSRLDTFNLVALEAMLCGCPVVVSRNAGFTRFIQKRFPNLPVGIINLDCSRSGRTAIMEISSNYDKYRDRLVNALQQSDLSGDSTSLLKIYETAGEGDLRARSQVKELAVRFSMFLNPYHSHYLPLAIKTFVSVSKRHRRLVPGFARKSAKSLLKLYRLHRSRNLRYYLKAKLKDIIPNTIGLSAKSVAQLHFIRGTSKIYETLLTHGERLSHELDNKISYLCGVVDRQFVDRVRLYRELARLEQKRGRDLVAATYLLRIMRWMAKDNFKDIPFVIDTLQRHGYIDDALVADAMFGPNASDKQQKELLQEFLERNRRKNDLPLEIFDDYRIEGHSKVSVIVSLYNAAPKLKTFIEMIRQQSLMPEKLVEVIFIDSGSTTNEYEIFREAMHNNPFPALYARSHQRETIQAAWNRGIKLARSEYLTFLGVDEGIHPQCLEILAKELDANPKIDWVMADSIVTSVDRKGIFDYDIMLYDRNEYRQEWHYLDCTYLSYVGGLYRRNIHERLGYYDETFAAAGDTEFKNRILPFIHSKHIPMTLGVFNNYPEERTTQHPRAEIEDLRAWYLHRTVAGVDYAFKNYDTECVINLLKDTIRYRKCFCGHWSTDLELALSLSRYLDKQPDLKSKLSLTAGLEKLLILYRGMDMLSIKGRSIPGAGLLIKTWREAKKIEKEHKTLLEMKENPAYDIFNDNRYEQHFWSWKS